MSDDNPELFDRLEPPAGGLPRLMARIDALEERPRRRSWRIPAAVALITVTTALIVWVANPPSSASTSTDLLASATHPSFAALGLKPRPEQAVSQHPDNDGPAFRKIPTSSPGVALYVVDEAGEP